MNSKVATSPLFLSIIAALLLSAAWYVYPVFIFVGFVPLLHLAHLYIQRPKGSFIGSFGIWAYSSLLLWNVCTTWWVWNASPAGAIAAMVLNSCFMLVPWLLYKWLLGKHSTSYTWLPLTGLIVTWLGFEYLHLNWEFTWPWLTVGNCFAFAHYLVQWYEYTGHLGGTLWALLVNGLVYQAITTPYSRRKPIVLAIGVVVILPITLSLIRYVTYTETGKKQEFVVIQPNVDPYTEKFPDNPNFIPFEKQLQNLITLSSMVVTDSTTVLAWPETALPVGFDELLIEDQSYIRKIRAFINAYPKLMLITGTDTYVIYGGLFDASPTARYGEGVGYYDYFNTAVAIENKLKTRFYHKSKLVPGVENMPYGYLLKFLDLFVIDLGGITGSLGTQAERAVFESTSGPKVAPVICYESVFGGFVGDYIKKGASYICIITNDGWWGNTPGHVQHLHYARLRAIETRRSIARSANTGISGFINQRGDILTSNQYGKPDAIRYSIAENTKLTLYVIFGDWIGIVAATASIVLLLYGALSTMVQITKKITRKHE